MNVAGIKYNKPEVFLLQETGIGTAEVAARTCYDSFDKSENTSINEIPLRIIDPKEINSIEHSDLLDDLAWTYFHHSILEHSVLTYLIKGTSRGVLQEQSRHRIQSLSVRSTRYTMSSVINAFVTSLFLTNANKSKDWFIQKMLEFDLFVINDNEYNYIEISAIWDKLMYQVQSLGKEEFIKIAIAKSSLSLIENNTAHPNKLFESLENGKKKRNVGDSFKHIITDNMKVDLVVTFNLRSLKNYLDLRTSGAAYFQIQMLAQEIKKATPKKYLKLIDKKYKTKKEK